MDNTYVTMNGGQVGRNVYGGGNLASVGKGNYAGGSDDYYPAGYGETLNDNTEPGDKILWTPSADFNPDLPIGPSNTPVTNADYFLSSGKTTVKVFGGIVGIEADLTKTKNKLPYGNVFGGSAGEAAPNVPVIATPRYHYCPAFFSGYVNETNVTIGGGYRCTTACTIGGKTYKVGDTVSTEEYNAFASGKSNWTAIITTPRILASVYGGGQDGHVRRDAHVEVFNGEIGLPYNADNQTRLKTSDLDDDVWMQRGNVYGAGSGISQYDFDFDNDSIIGDSVTISGRKYAEHGYSTSAGSVTRFTQVDIMGGTIHRNVYGGGSLATVGAPKITQDYDPYKKCDETVDPAHSVGKQSQCTVNIAGTVGSPTGYNVVYGGEVYGASRGMAILDPNQYANAVWTKVNVLNGAYIKGNVYGGGDSGIVRKDAEVTVGATAEP